MKREPVENLQQSTATEPATSRRRHWFWSLALLAALIAMVLLWYGETTAAMIDVWLNSETYTHGFIVAPLSLYLIWLVRKDVGALSPSPSILGVILLIPLGFAWTLAHLAGVNVVAQYAMVAMIPAIVLALFGRKVTWRIAFPLSFLLLCVPSGEMLLEPMMNFTADFTVGMLRLTGIPVFREGNFISVPSGEWSVVEACSGLRYLIASFTGGCLFAYLYYRTVWKRVAMVAASIVVPIIANGFRAYMIVMIGHLSDMRLAVGVDHFIYGWVFFGFVMFLLFWLGSKWSEDATESPVTAAAVGTQRTQPSVAMLGIALAVIVAFGVWPTYAEHLIAKSARANRAAIEAPSAVGPWRVSNSEVTSWRPYFKGADQMLTQFYERDSDLVMFYLADYHHQRQGSELVSEHNVLVMRDADRWRITGTEIRADVEGAYQVRETRLRSGDNRLLVWQWFAIDGHRVTNQHVEKLLLARMMLVKGRGDGAAVILATPYSEDPEAGRARLRAFLTDMGPKLDTAIARNGNP